MVRPSVDAEIRSLSFRPIPDLVMRSGAAGRPDVQRTESAAATAPARMDHQLVSRPKITPVPLRETTLLRDRLVERLREGAARRLTLIVAEAGFGKTTLLADFSRRRIVRCLWYKLDSSDRDWVSFLTYLVAAGREAEPGFAPATAALLDGLTTTNPGRDAALDTFMAELPVLASEPTVLILDDYNSVDDSADVRAIVWRMLSTGPEGFGLIIGSRRPPLLELGRLAAHDDLRELDTDDLRFSRDETDDLFASVYRQPLEPEMVDEIESRTEGWAASLQLLHSSIRERTPSEIRTFVRRLSGAEGRLYDFLAEEVLRGLRPDIARFMVHAALLDRIVPEHVLPIFAPDPHPPTTDVVEGWIREVADLGLCGKRSDTSRSYRFHPLLREFLLRRLRESTSAAAIREMHMRIARAAEADDWLAACRHYLDAGSAGDAMRVLDASALEAIGAGLWEPAAELVERRTDDPDDVISNVILARRDVSTGKAHRGLARLRSIDLRGAPPVARSLSLQAMAAASWHVGDDEGVSRAISSLLLDEEIPIVIRDIAEGLDRVRLACGAGSIVDAVDFLESILPRQLSGRLHFYAGSTLHNICCGRLALGDYRGAIERGDDALDHWRQLAGGARDASTTLMTLAESSFESGLWNQGIDYLDRGRATASRQPDALGHAAVLLASLGMAQEARQTLKDAVELLTAENMQSAGSLECWRASVALGDRRHTGEDPGARYLSAVGALAAVGYLRAASAALDGRYEEATAYAADGLGIATKQRSVHWTRRLRVVSAVARSDASDLSDALDTRGSELLALEVAPILADALHVPAKVPDALRSSIDRWPRRWLPQLRRQLNRRSHPAALRAAELLDEFGEKSDVVLLRAFERTYLRGSKARGFGRGLRQRTAADLHVFDLGRTRLEVDGRVVAGTGMRRRALALLLFLTTRPAKTSTREQVLEHLWPQADPESANNSLHQTLFFLRRDIEPWFDEDTSFSYVRNEGDLVWLDDEKVIVQSAQFSTRAAAQGPNASVESRAEVLGLYSGQFAPEFEYEDWAMARRDHLQAQFLAVTEAQVVALWRGGDFESAIATARHAVTLDPDSLGFEAALVALYAQSGADAASVRQYEHYASRMREVLGTEPEPRSRLIGLSPDGLRSLD